MVYSLLAECGVANLVIRFLNYTFVSFFSWKRIILIDLNFIHEYIFMERNYGNATPHFAELIRRISMRNSSFL